MSRDEPQLLLPLATFEWVSGTYQARVKMLSDETADPSHLYQVGVLVAVLRDHGCGGRDPMFALRFGDRVAEYWPEELEWVGQRPRVAVEEGAA